MILYHAIFFMLYTVVSSIPMHPSFPLASYTNRKRYKTDEEIPNNTTGNIKSRLPQTSGHSLDVADPYSKGRSPEVFAKNGVKRGLDIGVHFNFRTTEKYSNSLNKLENILEKALEGGLEEVLNTSPCPQCEEEVVGQPGSPRRRLVKPAYQCDDWDPNLRLCVLERNIGDTVTFYLSTGVVKGHKYNITWKKEFHMQNSETRTGFVIDPDNSPQNIIIGKQGYELRVSPITEIDVGYNLFSATINGHSSRQSKVYYVIRIVPIDLGFVYVGETIELNLRSFTSLPSESLTFKWYMEKYGEHGTLPSNMRTSASGSSIKISELRQEQEGILACSVYTNLAFLATKKRFLIKDLLKNKDVLQSAPNHNLTFKEEQPTISKRNPKKVVRHKRYLNIDEIIEKALESTTTETHVTDNPTRETSSRSNNDYDLGIDIGKGEPKIKTFENFENSDEADNRYQEVDEEVGKHSQPTKHFDASAENNHARMEEHGESAYIQSNYQSQDNKEDLAPSLQSSMVNHPGIKPFKQHSSGENSHHLNGLAKDRSHQENGIEDSVMSEDNVRKYVDAEKRGGSYEAGTEGSEIILNIDKVPGPRRISAEENISRLITSCYTDFECSAAATCVRTNLKQKGFCKCLPGYYGVGIFCREDIWLSKSNFDLEDIQNSEDLPYSSIFPAF